MRIPFTKYHGSGNDFILVDSDHFPLQLDISSLARSLCDRRLGIGADGVILLCASSVADYKMRIFNADGSEPSMCGNGIRCLVDFVQTREHRFSELNIETLHGILKCRRSEKEIAVNLGVPRILHWPIELAQGSIFVVDTGVPHAILFSEEIDDKNVSEEGAQIRFHPQFAPFGVNVNFVSVKSESEIKLRTYERGVGETLACGTGAAAAAFAAMKHHRLQAPISVFTRLSFGKYPVEYHQDLRFQFRTHGKGELEIEMIGGVEKVFEGCFELSKKSM